ncbi:MAG TPA: DEAD/DEAH box helicase [Armatimonadota bacterium]|nr:DEAD/DEAH box helicase [Armatimonadota bacterium]
MDLEGFLQELRSAEDYRGQIEHIAKIPAREARYSELTVPLHPRLRERLEALGIKRLYSHQAEAVNKALDGSHIAVVTSTASGKTLCYNLPVLHTQLTLPGKTALYMFPTKALAQDQLRKLREFGLSDGPRFGVYDGDTPAADKRAIRRNCHTILTNPDMLHTGILPNHMNWAEFFRNLAFVVIDEMHVYRGIFGAHMANIVRRLRRVCRHYGSVPQFIACSATIGSPEELMRVLTGVKAEVVDDDGSPAGEKRLVFWNPPYIGEGERKSANSEAASLFVWLVRNGIRNITFTKARVVAELIYRYARESLSDSPDLACRIMSYRGGYTPEQRREIERGLFDGSLVGVTATTALELGVDIGDLEACVLTGYPGTIASTWQQIGRAGRGRRSSLAILVALDNPLDQFLVNNPGYVLDAANERVIVDPHNPYILSEHLLCAAYEIPITELDFSLFGGDVERIVREAEESGRVSAGERMWFWSGWGYPASGVNIRSAGGTGFAVYDLANPDEVLGTVEEASAFSMLHEGAVYLHQGESYVVQRLDIAERRAFVSQREVGYYTTPRTFTQIEIKSESASRPQGSGSVHFGEISVTTQVTGFWKKRILTEACLEVVDLDLPCQSFHTKGLWFTLDAPVGVDVLSRPLGLEGGTHALEHAFIGIMPLCAMCDTLDIGGASHPLHPQSGLPTIFIYDSHPGGVGISEAAYARADELLQYTLQVVSQCPCADGCPACIQSAKCGDNNFPLDKQSALSTLRYLMG